MRVAALAGGVGGSKLLLGLARALRPGELAAIVNTGDDIRLHGLCISPDLDIVTYTLAEAVNPQTGWGLAGDTFRLLEALERFGHQPWFHLGDADLATHLHRTAMLQNGATLSAVADSIRRAFGVATRILPMTDQPVQTILDSDRGRLHLQEYLVKHRAVPVVKGIYFEGVEGARPAPGVLEALASADSIVIGPSNPLISIGPILAVPGIEQALRRRADSVIAVSPIVAGRSLKGPSDKMLAQTGREATALGVARLYAGIAGTYVIDSEDAEQRAAIEALGFRVAVTGTVMQTQEDKERLAREVLALRPAARDAGAGTPPARSPASLLSAREEQPMKAVLIPVKDLRQAKQRLAMHLSQKQRTALAEAMMTDVFVAVAAARGIDRVFVVTSYGPAIELTRHHGWEALVETEQNSESASVDEASRRCQALGVQALLRLPIDLPLLRPEDVGWIFAESEPAPSVVLVPSRSGGTNAILRSPPTLFPSHFGIHSLARHLVEAERAGARVKVLRNDRLALDIDDADDLAALRAWEPLSGATAQWLAAAKLTGAIRSASC